MENRLKFSGLPFEQTAQQGEEAFRIYQEILDLKKTLSYSFIELGKRFYIIEVQQLYRVLGYETFPEFIASPEIGFQLSWVKKLMKLWETYCLRLEISEEKIAKIDIRRLLQVMPIIRENIGDKKIVSEWIEKARVLPNIDFKLEILEYYQKVIPEMKDVILVLSPFQMKNLLLKLFGKEKEIAIKKVIEKYRKFELLRDPELGEKWEFEPIAT
ncbi:MAG: hypothetical protein AB1567_04040 [bacterium]